MNIDDESIEEREKSHVWICRHKTPPSSTRSLHPPPPISTALSIAPTSSTRLLDCALATPSATELLAPLFNGHDDHSVSVDLDGWNPCDFDGHDGKGRNIAAVAALDAVGLNNSFLASRIFSIFLFQDAFSGIDDPTGCDHCVGSGCWHQCSG